MGRRDDDDEWIQVGRNPFGRYDIIRRCIPNSKGQDKCDWCGAKPKRLYQYGTWYDGGRKSHMKGVFCNKGCAEAYHGISLR